MWISVVKSCVWIIVALVLATSSAAIAAEDLGRGQVAAGRSPSKKVGPRLVVEQPIHDFGVLAPQEMSEHEFVLKNDGDEPLVITDVIASCKCVLPEQEINTIEPGESIEVKVGFKGKPVKDRYSQSVKLYSNDPTRPVYELRVVGKIAATIVVDPDSLLFPRLLPGEHVSDRFDLLSESWREFDVVSTSCDNEGVAVRAEPYGEKAKKGRNASSGWRVYVDFDTPKDVKDFEYQVYLTVAPRDPVGPERTLRVPIVGEVKRRIAVYGEGIDQFGRMDLGQVDPRTGVRRRYMVRVRDEETEMPVKKITVEPSYVEITLEPYRQTNSERLYRLNVTVPPGKLKGAFIGPTAGMFRIDFDHPRIPALEMQLEMLPQARY